MAALSDYDKFIVKHLQTLQWLESLEKDYQANKLKFPRELEAATRSLKFILNEIGKKQMTEGNHP